MTRNVNVLYDVCKLVKRTPSTSSYFSFTAKQLSKKSYIKIDVDPDFASTKSLPFTYEFLKMHLPSILKSKCFNTHNFPFTKEVKSTQLGHLFEHIILEYLSASKRSRGYKNTIHNGLTSWNWNEDKYGIFHIDIDSKKSDEKLFQIAVEKASLLLSTLIRKSATNGTDDLRHLHH